MTDNNKAEIATLQDAILYVSEQCQFVEKNTEVKFKAKSGAEVGYFAAGEEDFLKVISPAMRFAKLTIVCKDVEPLVANINNFIGKYTWEVQFNDETRIIRSLGQGADIGDKATSKAATNGRKYALRHLFNIATGDDPDAFHSEQIKQEQEEHQKQIKTLNDNQQYYKDVGNAIAKYKDITTLQEYFDVVKAGDKFKQLPQAGQDALNKAFEGKIKEMEGKQND
jgi:hypothetical protein